MAFTFAGSMYPKLSIDAIAVSEEEDDDDEDDEEEDGEDSAETGSTSSFSLQECINEFRARRIRRVSTHSRDREMPPVNEEPTAPATTADAHLINQNRCNKAQERKGKPCKNGFCYCFTSDSGDCASIAPPTRDWHVRQNRRSRRSENTKVSTTKQLQNNLSAQQIQNHKETGRRSLPSNSSKQLSAHSSASTRPLTAVSSLRAVGDNAPLIHIIQELRDNCVISEVRVNEEKLSKSKRSTITTCKQKTALPKMQKAECIDYQPTAPTLSKISEKETPEQSDSFEQGSLVGGSLHSTRRSSRRSSGGGGRLLQKRLSLGSVNFKLRDFQEPPPKPPRRSAQSLDGKTSLSSLTSTTASVKEAERVLDEFLRKHGAQVPCSKSEKLSKTKSKRRSYPLAEMEQPVRSSHLPTCPSLSDLERVVQSKRGVHYAKNIDIINRKSTVSDKPMKEIMLGWTEPKINDMLNYDASQKMQFKTHAPEPAPQVANVGWQVPVAPKISLDTVDGVSENLAVNIEKKHTPIKYPRIPVSKHSSQKFMWGDTLRNLSWNGNNKRSGFRNKSKKFLNNSKNKILRFVSPKKANQSEERPRRTTRLCNVGVQTSTSQLQLDLQSQSPPGSYHSPVQSTPSATTSSINQQHNQVESPRQPYFDFQRKVKPPTPPQKVPRAHRARKLNFQSENTSAPTTTYRSYHKDLDQDVTITKMGYLLSNIRAKLEASDQHAVRTFRECSRFDPLERPEVPSDNGLDCTDGPVSTRMRRSTATMCRRYVIDGEPIYSEIEEDCMRITGSPQFDVRTSAHLSLGLTPTPTSTATTNASVTAAAAASATATVSESTPMPSQSSSSASEREPPSVDLNALYAKVQKPNKPLSTVVQSKPVSQPRPLGQFLQESLMNGSIFQFMPLPDEPNSDTTYTRSTLGSFNRLCEQSTLPLHQSLNNINEQHSPPKKNRNLSKSDLSLQRSEIFLENLCRSEIVLDQDENLRLEKVPNTCLRANNAADAVDVDAVSYDLPHEVYDDYEGNASGTWLGNNSQSQYGSAQIEPLPPTSHNQSTPKKQTQRFTTKPRDDLCIDIIDGPSVSGRSIFHSCPTTPMQPDKPSNVKQAHSSLGELAEKEHNESQLLSMSTLARYRLLKDALRRSYRKGKDFFVAEKQRLAQNLSMSRDQSHQTEGELDSSGCYVSFNVDSLLNESLNTCEQLAQAVNICRQMPELEISPEMVEAERLLLFSSLQQQTLPAQLSEPTLASRRQAQCFLIDGLRLPVKADANQDMFFNYYYICTIECEGRILSTQSIECQNGAAVFGDCGLEFFSSTQVEELELRCKIFMLRLRKVSTLSLEPSKTTLKRGSLVSNSSSSSSAYDQIVSRFRLHASFTLKASDLVPYELVLSDIQDSDDKIRVRTSRSWQLPVKLHKKFSNLMPEIELSGRAELRLPKMQYAGYLNVQDMQPNKKHNWNRRWCTLDGLCLSIWQYEHNLSEQPPLLALQLENCQQSHLDIAPRELCARARSFLVRCNHSEAFFAADTQPELTEWLSHLNEALAFAKRWLSASLQC